MYLVYILWCRETGRTYVGQTDNLLRRFLAHRDGSTRTTRDRLRDPVVVYWEAHPTRSAAMQRERYFKQGVRGLLRSSLLGKVFFQKFKNPLCLNGVLTWVSGMGSCIFVGMVVGVILGTNNP